MGVTEETSSHDAASPSAKPAQRATVEHATVEVAVAQLVTRGKERGVLTSAEVFAAFRDLQPDTGELAAIYSVIEAAGVTVQDEIRDELELEDRRARRRRPSRRQRTSAHRGRIADQPPG